MGLTSGRGTHGGARRRRAGSANEGNAWQGDGGQNRTSLVAGDQQETDYWGAPAGNGQRGADPNAGHGYQAGGGWNEHQATGQAHGQVPPFLDDAPAPRQRAGRARAGRRASAGRRRGGLLGGYPAPVISVVAIVVCAAVVAAGFGVNHMLTASPAADATVDPNCTLIVPANPLTAQGLATPYQLTATDPAAGPCDESNDGQTAFVQGAVINPRTGQISVYNPLVVNAGAQPAAAPVVPKLPNGAVVALWFGYNGDTLTLAGADQNLTTGATATATQAPPTDTATATATAAPTDAASATPTATQAAPTNQASASATATPSASASASGSASTGSPTTGPQATGAATPSSGASTGGASPQSVGSAPLQPSSAGSAGLNASLSNNTSGSATTDATHHPRRSSSPSASATPPQTAAQTQTAAPTQTDAPTQAATTGTTPTATSTATGGTQTDPAGNAGDSPAASGTQDAILQGANCVAGENINGEFSSFTQVGACNAPAFFNAANMAIAAHKLRVPAPGTARDGQTCLTTRSFALIDQDQSDNVTTEYLTTGNGQTAQDTAANRGSLSGATTLVNGSDNGLLDLFVDPALGCSPWKVPNLADGGAATTGLPLDELQAAAWAGRQNSGPAALVPLNDPMTVDDNGNFSPDKTNTYRSLVDMAALPAGQSPAAYCSDMERVQGTRLQQDYNLLVKGTSPQPDAASNLFTFLAMRLQQSYTNLNCGSFGQGNDVSTTTDGNGVVVAACFVNQVRAITRGPGNPMAGHRMCPATTGGQGNGQGNGQGTGQGNGHGMSHHQVRNYWRHHHHG